MRDNLRILKDTLVLTFHFVAVIISNAFRGVAKLGIALGSGPRGRGFESRHSDHVKQLCFSNSFIEKQSCFLSVSLAMTCFSI